MGFSLVRLRDYDRIARIEIKSEQFSEAVRKRDEITNSLSQLGYIYITLILVDIIAAQWIDCAMKLIRTIERDDDRASSSWAMVHL